MASMARGSAASLVLVAKAMVAGSATARRKFAEGQAREQQRGQHSHEREDDDRNVEGERQLAEVEHHAESRLRDGKGESGGDADGCVEHDEVGEGEHHFGEGFAKAEHGRAFRLADAAEGEPEEDGEDDDLENLIVGDGAGDVFREDVQEELLPGDGGLLGERGRGDGGVRAHVEADASL
jgi:Ni/Co efflux regulator RcnB